MTTPLPAHIAAGFIVDDSGCWVWQRSLSRDGYGWTSLNNRTYQAHRLVYTLLVGSIPDGLVIDHLCRVRHCVNPDHMEPVTPGENIRRSELTPAGMTECRKGHGPLSQYRAQRRCLVCLREYHREQERKRRASVRAAREAS